MKTFTLTTDINAPTEDHLKLVEQAAANGGTPYEPDNHTVYGVQFPDGMVALHIDGRNDVQYGTPDDLDNYIPWFNMSDVEWDK